MLVATELASKINITIENARLAYEVYLLKKEAFKRGWMSYHPSALIGLEGKEDILIKSPEHLMEVAEELNKAKAEHVAGLANERNFAFLTLALFQRPWAIETLPGLGAAYSIITSGSMVRWDFEEFFFEGTQISRSAREHFSNERSQKERREHWKQCASSMADPKKAALVMFGEWCEVSIGDLISRKTHESIESWVLYESRIAGITSYYFDSHCRFSGSWRKTEEQIGKKYFPEMEFRAHIPIPSGSISAGEYIGDILLVVRERVANPHLGPEKLSFEMRRSTGWNRLHIPGKHR
ncbi:MAG: hypothetical protein HGA33_00525 [Candidatus Moranbacteria bacterium]|nr:hypothetical protein [Candidatus Moranbacteria bacterium]